MSDIHLLSKELLLPVVESLIETRDLKSLRLVNKSLSILATAQLFKTVIARFQSNGLSNLMEISRHPLLRHHVKSLLCEIDGPPNGYWNYEAQTNLHTLTAAPTDILDLPWVLACLLDEASRLACVMANLPNINAIHFTEMIDVTVVESSVSGTSEPFTAFEDLPEALQGQGVRSFLAIMRAMSINSNLVTTLEVSDQLHGLHYSFLNLSGLDSHHVVAMFTNLTVISIYINTKSGEERSQAILRQGNLSGLLTHAKSLQQLSLGFDQRPSEPVRLANILGSSHWKFLRTLRLTALDFHLREMRAFVEQHRKITTFGIANCRLYSGSLRGLFELIRDRLPLLKRVRLDGALGDRTSDFDFLQGCANERAGRNFLMGKGPYPNFVVTDEAAEKVSDEVSDSDSDED